MRQQQQVSVVRFKAVFPWRFTLGDVAVIKGNSTFHDIPPYINFVGGIPCVTARKKASKNLSSWSWRLLCGLFTCTCFLKWKDCGSQKKLFFFPEVPLNASSISLGGNVRLERFTFRFHLLFESRIECSSKNVKHHQHVPATRFNTVCRMAVSLGTPPTKLIERDNSSNVDFLSLPFIFNHVDHQGKRVLNLAADTCSCHLTLFVATFNLLSQKLT